jgi:type VI protein secretion system component Hcp
MTPEEARKRGLNVRGKKPTRHGPAYKKAAQGQQMASFSLDANPKEFYSGTPIVASFNKEANVNGNVKIKGYEGYIQVLEYGLGVLRNIEQISGLDATSAERDGIFFGEIGIRKPIDSGSPSLMNFMFNFEKYKKNKNTMSIVVLDSAESTANVFAKLEFRSIFPTRLDLDSQDWTECWAFGYEELEIKYMNEIYSLNLLQRPDSVSLQSFDQFDLYRQVCSEVKQGGDPMNITFSRPGASSLEGLQVKKLALEERLGLSKILESRG